MDGRTILQEDPENAEAIFFQALFIYQAGKFHEAEENLKNLTRGEFTQRKEGLIRTIKELQSKMNAINDAVKQEKVDEVLKFCQQVLEVAPPCLLVNAGCHVNAAEALFHKNKKWAKIIEHCTIALNLNPNLAHAHVLRARSHFRGKAYDQAIDDFQQADKLKALSEGLSLLCCSLSFSFHSFHFFFHS